jgi:hypothetical protein
MIIINSASYFVIQVMFNTRFRQVLLGHCWRRVDNRIVSWTFSPVTIEMRNFTHKSSIDVTHV